MIPFRYARINETLIDEMCDKVLLGESLVLVGARYSGKQYLMRRLRDLLQAQGVDRIVEFSLTSERQSLEEQNEGLFQRKVASDLQGQSQSSQWTNLFQEIDESLATSRGPLVLLTANVDGTTFDLARSFLQGVRVRVEAGRLIAILTGEHDFRDLVHGPTSEFDCANQFVIQGHAEGEFHTYLVEQCRNLDIEFEGPKATSRLWDLTGGNIHMMKAILLWLVERRAGRSLQEDTKIQDSDLLDADLLDAFSSLDGPLGNIYASVMQLVAEEPDCWGDLTRLIRDGRVQVGWDDAPSQLELAGVALRERTNSVTELCFSSLLMNSFVNHQYDNRRVGNLYASVGDWEQAFSHYLRLKAPDTVQPSSFKEKSEVRATVAALCSSLYAQAARNQRPGESITAIKTLFMKGSRFVLGFSEISFWARDFSRSELDWELIEPKEYAPDDSTCRLIKTSLPSIIEGSEWEFKVPLNQFAHAALLPALRGDQRIAVVLSELGRRVVISRDRVRVAKNLLQHFSKAYAQANELDRLQLRLRVRDQHVKTINSIFNALGTDVQNVGQVFEMAAKGLRQMGYKRVIFSLVDPEEQRIQGYLADSTDSPFDLASLIDLPLSDPVDDIQTLAIREAKPYRIPDASKDLRVNAHLVAGANLHAFAVVPILKTSKKPIGTIQVERNDGLVPSKDEIKDLLFFGRQLAIAIEQGERVNMLQSTLDKIPEPIVIVDRTEQLRYANQPAARLLNNQEGWMTSQTRLEEKVGGISSSLLQQSMKSGYRLVGHFEGFGSDPSYRGAGLTDIIKDWRGITTGGFLHIQDLKYLDKVFRVARLIGEAQDTASALSRMFDAARILGRQWGALYLSDDEDNPKRLISKLSFGYDDLAVEKRFREGGIILDRDTPNGIDWLAFERRKPVVFSWKDELPANRFYVTKYGLHALNSPNPPQPLEIAKKPGDFWIDFPLMAQNKILGKVSFQCEENLLPEDFELLTMLSETVVGLIGAYLSRAEAVDAREETIKVSVAEKMMATIAHNIGARLAHLPILLSRYRNVEKGQAELSAINDQFAETLTKALDTIARAKEALLPINPRKLRVDIVELIENTLHQALPRQAWSLTCQEGATELSVDYHLFETALLELIQNSRNIVASGQLRIAIILELIPAKPDWVRILYEDNGPGIRGELLEKIFDDFFSSRDGQNRGTGLGMGMVRRVVEAHNGFIIALPSSRGACFAITLPKQGDL